MKTQAKPKEIRAARCWKAIGGGAYEERRTDSGKPTGRFAERPRGKTWRLLRTVSTRRAAINAATGRDPRTIGSKFASLAQRYLDAGCPDSNNEHRHAAYCAGEKSAINWLVKFFGTWPVDRLSHADWPEYKKFRTAQMRAGCTGLRAVDKDHQTLSNIFQYAMVNRMFPGNPFSQRYKHYQRADLIKTSRQRAPRSADDIHQVAGELLGKLVNEAAGWLTLFAMFTGCRISELLRLRVDARHPGPDRYDPGYIEQCAGDEPKFSRFFLHLGKRSKNGINPQVVIGPEFQAMLAAFQNWHQQRWPECASYFPNDRGVAALDRFTARRQIARAAANLGLHHITPHGYRSFYGSKRRSEGINDAQIAWEMGDKSIVVVQNNYATAPESWTGGKVIGWLPKSGNPAWTDWLPDNFGKFDFSLTEPKRKNAVSVNRINEAGVAKWQTHRT